MRYPANVLLRKNQDNAARHNAIGKAIVARLPSNRAGSSRLSSKTLDCGKLNPVGSRHGTRTIQDRSSCAMYTSMRLTRISLVLKRDLNSAGMAAHAAPPSAPAMSIAGSVAEARVFPQNKATPPPQIWPRGKLRLGADIPDVGLEAEGQVQCAHHEWRGLQQELAESIQG